MLAAAATCAALAVGYAAAAWWVVFSQRWGPVVAVIDEQAGMGVHSGDVIGVLAAVMAVVCGLFAVVLLDEAIGGGMRTATARVAHRQPSRLRPAPIASVGPGGVTPPSPPDPNSPCSPKAP